MRYRKLSKPDLSDIPLGSTGFHAHNGIAARLYHYMTHSRRFQEDDYDKALVVQVPHTTTAKMFRIHILNYLHGRGMTVSTSVRDKTEILVWLRGGGYRAGDRLSVPFEASEFASLWPAGGDEEYSECSDEDKRIEAIEKADEIRAEREHERSLVRSLKIVKKIIGVGSSKFRVPNASNVARLTDFGKLDDRDTFRANLKKHLGAPGDERTWQMPVEWAEAYDNYFFGRDEEYMTKRDLMTGTVDGRRAIKQHRKRKKRFMRLIKNRG